MTRKHKQHEPTKVYGEVLLDLGPVNNGTHGIVYRLDRPVDLASDLAGSTSVVLMNAFGEVFPANETGAVVDFTPLDIVVVTE